MKCSKCNETKIFAVIHDYYDYPTRNYKSNIDPTPFCRQCFSTLTDITSFENKLRKHKTHYPDWMPNNIIQHLKLLMNESDHTPSTNTKPINSKILMPEEALPQNNIGA